MKYIDLSNYTLCLRDDKLILYAYTFGSKYEYFVDADIKNYNISVRQSKPEYIYFF